jgi:hypothetical protein
MIPIPRRPVFVTFPVLMLQYAVGAVAGLAATRPVSTSVVAQCFGLLLFPFCYWLGTRLWIGIALLAELRAKGIQGVASEVRSGVNQMLDMAQGKPVKIAPRVEHVRPGGSVFVATWIVVAGMYGVLLAFFAGAALSIVGLSFALLGLLLGGVDCWLVRSGYIDLWQHSDDSVFGDFDASQPVGESHKSHEALDVSTERAGSAPSKGTTP